MEQLTHPLPISIDPVDPSGRRRALLGIVSEVIVVYGLWLGYRQVRHLTRDQAHEAFSNARQVIDFERRVNLFNERAVQRFVLHSDEIVWLLNQYYARVHLPLTALFAVWLLLRHRGWYRKARTWMITVTSAALLIHVMYPLAPPRMMRGHGFVDTLRERGLNLYSPNPTNSFANQFAAMPSLHFGWAVIVAVVFVAVKRTRRSALVLAHPAITLLAIVATANHYWLDAIIALMLVAGVYWLSMVMLRRSSRLRSSDTSVTAGKRPGGSVDDVERVAEGDWMVVQDFERDRDQVVAADDARFGDTMLDTKFHP